MKFLISLILLGLLVYIRSEEYEEEPDDEEFELEIEEEEPSDEEASVRNARRGHSTRSMKSVRKIFSRKRNRDKSYYAPQSYRTLYGRRRNIRRREKLNHDDKKLPTEQAEVEEQAEIAKPSE